MKKIVLSVLIITIMCLMYAAAGAAPSVTDGKTTGWIAENNYLFLQTTGGTVAQLSMEINDLIRITEDELICLGFGCDPFEGFRSYICHVISSGC